MCKGQLEQGTKGIFTFFGQPHTFPTESINIEKI
jgi:hypothetical protein